ncbi:MAG: hypothetical protein ACTS3F_09065 [Phycisphaerales bacterium]
MYPSVADVVRMRLVARAVFRVAGFVAMLFSIAPWSSWLIEGISDGDLFWFSYYSGRIIAGFVAIVLGLAMLLAARPLARLLIPMRAEIDCPACRYILVGMSGDRCPECGLRLPEGFAGMGDEVSTDRERRRVIERGSHAGLFRWGGVVGIACGVAGGALGSLFGLYMLFMEYESGIGLIVLSAIAGTAVAGLGVGSVLYSDRIRSAARRLKEAEGAGA